MFKVGPQKVVHVNVLVALVAWQLQPQHVPALDRRRNLRAVVVQVVSSDSCEQFTLLRAAFPVFKLPLVPIDEHSNDSLPASFSEVLDVVVDLEGVLFVGNLVFNLNDGTSLGVVDEFRRV